ncbi:hypothetical protein FJ365_04345, partial [Candidatus Dependentiae bacterium]|nr:hypothetical protein [Candidatus Dependentiae bacterium]
MKNFLINIALFIGLSLQHGLFAADALEKQLKGATSESEYEAILTQAKSLNLDARGQEKAKLRSIISAAQTALTSLRSTATAAATATATRGADTERSAREFKANIEKLKAALLSKSIAADAIRTKAYDEAIRDLEAIANQAARTTDEVVFQKLQDDILAAQKAVAEAQKDAERKEKEEEAAVQNEAAVKAFLDGMKTGGQAEEREVASSFSPVKDELLSTLQERFEKEVEKVKAKKAAVEQQKKLATETARKKALELQIDAEKKKSEDAETAKRQAEKEKADAQVLALAAEKLRLEEAERNKEALEKAKDDLLAQYIPKATHLLSLEVLDNESLKQATEHHMSNLRELAVKKLREGGGAYSDPEIQSKMNEIALQSYNLHPELYKDALQRILKEEFCSRAEITPSVCAQIIYEDPSIDEPFKTAAIELAKLKFQLEVEAPSQEQVEQILIELISSTAGYMDAKKTAILDALYKKFTPSADEILAAQVRAVQEARGKQSVKGKTPTYDTKKAEILATIGGEGLNTLDGQRAILINLLGGEAEAAQAIRQKAASLLDQTGRDSVAELDKAMLANAQAAAIARLRNKIISEQDALTAAEVARLRAQAINLWEEQASKESKFIKVDLVAAVEAYCQQLNFVAGGPFSEVKKQSKQELAKQVVGQSLFKEKTAASQSAAASTAVLTSEWQTVAALKESVGKSQDLFNADSMVKDLFGFWFQQYVSRGEQSLGILEGLNEAEQRSLVAIVLSKCELLSTKDSAYDDFPVAIANCAPYKSLSEMCKSLAASLFLRYQDITKLVGLVNKTLHSCIATDPVDSYKDFVDGIATESFEQPFGVKRLSEALCGVLNDPKNGIKVFNLDGSDADFQSKDFNNLITQVLLRVVKPLVNVVLSADRNLKDRGPIFATYVRQMLSMLSRSLKYDKMLIANWFERLALDASFWTTEDNSIVGSADEPGVSMLVSSGIQDGLYEAMERCAPSDDYREDLKSLVDFISLALYDALDFVQTKGLIAKKLSSLVKDKPYLSAIGAAVDYLSEESAKIAALEHFGTCSSDSTVQKLYKYMVSIKDALLEAQSAKDLLAALKKGKSKNDLPEYAQMKLKTTGAVATIKSATGG